MSSLAARSSPSEQGYVMAALLVAMGVMAVMLTVLLPVWSTAARREREAELIFRGEQYARAIRLFGMRYANALPPTTDVLVRERFLRKKYKDPITGDDFQVVGAAGGANQPGFPSGGRGRGRTGGAAAQPPQQGGRGGLGTVTTGVAGVVSKSTETSLRLYNGRGKYNEWVFMALQGNTRAGGPAGAPQPGRGGFGPRGAGPRGARPGGAAPPPNRGRFSLPPRGQ